MDGPKRTYINPIVAKTFTRRYSDEDLPYIRADIHEAAIAKRDERIAVLTRALELAIGRDDPLTNTDECFNIVKDTFITVAEAELEVKDDAL